jgi:hypothetical protein
MFGLLMMDCEWQHVGSCLHSNALEGATKHSVHGLGGRHSINLWAHVCSSTVRSRS